MNLTLKVWRQKSGSTVGEFVTYEARNVIPDMSFLEMLDVVNEGLIEKGEEPIAFDSDCREGICGMCSLVINGVAHGGHRGTATCQLHMRHFNDGETITIEPWRAKAFPIIKDLVVNRGAFDRVIAAGGFVSVSTDSTYGSRFKRCLERSSEELERMAPSSWRISRRRTSSRVRSTPWNTTRRT